MMPRGKTRLKIWLAILGVFALGCVTGASLDSVYRLRAAGGDARRGERGQRHDKEQVFKDMQQDLNLDGQQAQEVNAILEQTRNEYRALRAEVRPRYDAIRQAARARIRALLKPEQQQRFDAKVAERDARRNGRERESR